MTPYLTLGGEQDLPPSMRVWTRIVRVDAAHVLELRDPNDGQGSDPATKSRYQYLWAGGRLWRRHLPPAPLDLAASDTSHDAWADAGMPAWEPCDRSWQPRSVIEEYAEQMAAAPRQLGVAVLRRLPILSPAADTMMHRIGARYIHTVDLPVEPELVVVVGPITGAWYDVPLPPCPDCGGALQWAEAGWVPGARECAACGSLFAVEA